MWFIIPYGLPSVLPVAPGVPASSSHMRDVRHLHTVQMRREPERLCDQRCRSVSGVLSCKPSRLGGAMLVSLAHPCCCTRPPRLTHGQPFRCPHLLACITLSMSRLNSRMDILDFKLLYPFFPGPSRPVVLMRSMVDVLDRSARVTRGRGDDGRRRRCCSSRIRRRGAGIWT